MATAPVIVRSEMGDAAAQFANNFLSLLQLRQQGEQFQQQHALSQAELTQRNLEFERSAAQEDRARDIVAFTTLLPSLKPGTTVAQNGHVAALLERITGKSLADTPDLANMVITPETLENTVKPLMLEMFRGLPEDVQRRTLEIGSNNIITGQPVSNKDLQNKEAAANVTGQGIAQVAQNPEAVSDVGRVAVGLEQPTRFGGQTFETTTEASLFTNMAQLAVERERIRAAASTGNTQAQAAMMQAQADMIKSTRDSLIEQAGKAGVVLGPGAATQLVVAGMSGPDGLNRPLASVQDPNAKRVLTEGAKIFTSGVQSGESQVRSILGSSPEGQQLLTTLGAGSMFESMFGKEQAGQALQDFTKAAATAGIPGFAGYSHTNPWGPGGRGFTVTPSQPAPTGPAAAPGQPAAATNPVDTIPASAGLGDPREETAARLLAQGRMTDADVRSRFKGVSLTRITNRSRAIKAQTNRKK